jgi:hypothetical protein
MQPMFALLPALAACGILALSIMGLRAEDRPSSWPVLIQPFESTGGGGIMIAGYDPRIVDGRCLTDFTATTPEGEVYRNEVVFDAVPIDGGILCRNGRWRAKDGSAAGTTPFQLFVAGGVLRSPAR